MAERVLIKSFFLKYKDTLFFVFNFLIGGFIVPILLKLLEYLMKKYVGKFIGEFINSIYLTLLLPASAITNIITNFSNIRFDLSFWSLIPNSSGELLLLFSIQGVITATFLAIFRKQEHRRKYLFFLLIFYVLHIISRFYADFISFLSNTGGIKLGKGWSLSFLQMFWPVIISITLIYYISIKLNYKSLFIIILRYILLFSEVLITLFVGFIFIKIERDTGATNFDLLFYYIYILTLGFFLFLIVQIFRDFLKKRLKGVE